MTLKRIVFIRPGETDWNATGRFQGWVAVPLNDMGRQQARRLANFVRNIGITRLVSSDLRRARDTAEIIGDALGIEPIFDERLREQHIGIWQGLTVPEMHGWYAEDYAKLRADFEGYRIQGGESRKDVKKRADAALKEYIQKADDDNISVLGIISHTTAIMLMLRYLVPDLPLEHTHLGNSSVTTLRREGSAWKVTQTNDLMHLEGLESKYMPGDVRGDEK